VENDSAFQRHAWIQMPALRCNHNNQIRENARSTAGSKLIQVDLTQPLVTGRKILGVLRLRNSHFAQDDDCVVMSGAIARGPG
jgi:hypothetical protein